MQHGSADAAAVTKAIEDHHFKAHATGVGDHLKGTFVDEGRMMWVQDVTGDVGVAKVELDYPDVRFIDYFTLARVGGEWKIIHKSFQPQRKTK